MFRGSLVALVTPMQMDGEVDYLRLRQLVDWHVEQGSDGIVVMGTTGESSTLPEKEHCEVIRRVVEYTDRRIPVIAGTGANSTSEAIQLTRCAADAGVDACLLVTPYYNKPTQQGLFLHYKAVAEAVDIPQILYNVPSRTACDMHSETVCRLSGIDNIIGVKDATGEIERVARIRAEASADFAIYGGDDATSLELVLAGGQGVISVTANIAPAAMHKMIAFALAGNEEDAADIDARLAGLHRDLFLESSPIPVKWALAEMGRIEQGIRLPLTWFSKEHHEVLRAAMRLAGAIE